MQKVDLILKNAIVLTMDKDLHQYTPGALAVKGDSIAAVGFEKDILAEFSAKEVKDCGGQVVMPGLINTHTHIPMTMLRGLADDLRLDVWLLGYMMPVEREFVSPEFVALGTKIGCVESIRTGITCMNDMYYFEDTIAHTIADIGLRAVCSQSVMKFPTPDARSYEEALAMMRRFAEEFKDHPLIIPAVAPHAPYTCPPEILKACTELALEYDIPPAHPHRRNQGRSGEHAQGKRHAGGALHQETGRVRGEDYCRSLRPHRRRRDPHPAARQSGCGS